MTRFLLLLFPLLLWSCSPQGQWHKALGSEINELGARNWIVIADAAYPAPSDHSARLIMSPYSIPETLEETLQLIESSGHVKPRVFTAREAHQIDDGFAPGISFYHTEITQALHERGSLKLPERSLETMMKRSQNGHRILIIKTSTALPYSSIYIELESGYWDGDAETVLRSTTKPLKNQPTTSYYLTDQSHGST